MVTTNNKWIFPLIDWKGSIPLPGHPGAFGAIRKHDRHTGVDLYVPKTDLVLAVESGIVVSVEDYTGPKAKSPWWLPTSAIIVEGESGVVCYGEVNPIGVTKGDMILAGQVIANVVPVLHEGKERADIPGHSRFMLHFELYKTGTRKSVWWKLDEEKPDNLLDPTSKLMECYRAAK